MITAPTIRNIVCPISIPPAAFPTPSFAQKLELGKIEQQIQIPQYALWEYDQLRLQALPDRLQLGFTEKASGEFAREAAQEFIRIVRGEFGASDIIFNANLRLKIEDDERDPTANVFGAEKIAASLGGSNARGGVWLTYDGADSSFWWVELIPDTDASEWWIFSVQRRFTPFPEGDAEQESIYKWLEHSESELHTQCHILMGQK